jgi:hypothetical protein
MFAREFHPHRFLRAAHGTEPFRAYCRLRGIPLDEAKNTRQADVNRWSSAIATLPPDAKARIELELAQVNELAGGDGISHLLDAAVGGELPGDDIPGGPALALWFFLRRPALFREVFFHHEVREARYWRAARAPAGVAAADLPGRATALGEELRAFFRRDSGTGRFGAVEAHLLPDAVYFAARVADRTQLVEGFTETGTPALRRVRPSLSVLFAYRPADGTVHLRSPLRSADRIRSLLKCFGRAVLGTDIPYGTAAFDLERLKEPFHPLPDAPDMEGTRVKVLTLRYPARSGRRQLRLETLTADSPTAIDELLRAHVGEAARDLTVSHAELEVRLRLDGRPKTYPVELWPDRCGLACTPLGGRLYQCLRRWGLAHA